MAAIDKYLGSAVSAVEQASQICKKIQQQLVTEDTLIKKDRSPVTIADLASQAVICRSLKEAFPQMPIMAEEDASSLRRPENKELLKKIAAMLPGWTNEEILDSIDAGNYDGGSEFWTLDPIDGTKGFLRGGQYAAALALIKNGRPVLGVLGCPNLAPQAGGQQGVIFHAQQGKGVLYKQIGSTETTAVKVSDADGSGAVNFLESVESGHADHSLQSSIAAPFGDRANVVRYDSQVKYAVISRGEADVYLRLPNPKSPDYKEKIWDHAAGTAIVKEAGGTATDMHGRELDFSLGRKMLHNRGVVVTNGSMHEQIISLIKQNT